MRHFRDLGTLLQHWLRGECTIKRETDSEESQSILRHRGWLPHVDVPGGSYFITFRLVDSLPDRLIERWTKERKELEQEASRDGTRARPDMRQSLRKLLLQRIESRLDRSDGRCWVARPNVAKLVRDALLHFSGERYELLAWTVMPNHVHAVVRLGEPESVGDVVHSWKSFTGSRANELLGRTGRFWQPDYYEHLIRSPEELEKCVSYVLRNPERAGLEDWPWVGSGLK